MDEMEMIDVSDGKDKKVSEPVKKKKDKFMMGIYIALLVLIVLGLVTYFFGYDVLKPYIKV